MGRFTPRPCPSGAGGVTGTGRCYDQDMIRPRILWHTAYWSTWLAAYIVWRAQAWRLELWQAALIGLCAGGTSEVATRIATRRAKAQGRRSTPLP